MYDSTAKLPSGILRGNGNQFGDFDQCLSIGRDKTSNIEGKYCLASVDIHATPFSQEDTNSLEKAVYYARSYEFMRSNARDVSNYLTLNIKLLFKNINDSNNNYLYKFKIKEP